MKRAITNSRSDKPTKKSTSKIGVMTSERTKTFKHPSLKDTFRNSYGIDFRSQPESHGGFTWTTDKTGFYIKISPEIRKILGYGTKEVLGKRAADIFACKKNRVSKNSFPGLLKTRNPFLKVESICRKKNGKIVYLENSGTPVYDVNGRFAGYIGYSRDITKMKMSEEQSIIKSYAVNSSLIGVGLADLEGFITYANDALIKIIGFQSRKNLIGIHFSKIAGQNDYKKIMSDLKRKGCFSGERCVQREGGRSACITVRVNFVKSQNGKPICLMASFEDITIRKNSEMALRDSEEKYRKLFETMTQGLVYFDSKGKIIAANPSAEKILGIPIKGIIGKPLKELKIKFLKEDGTEIKYRNNPIVTAIETGKKSKSVLGLQNTNTNKTIWVYAAVVPHSGTGDIKPFQVFITFQDISAEIENKRLQQKLNERTKNYAIKLEEEVKARTKEIETLYSFNDAIIDNAGIGIISAAIDGTIMTYNPAAEAMLGYKPDEIISKLSIMKLLDENEIRAGLSRYVNLKKKEKITFNYLMRIVFEKIQGAFEWNLKRKDGTLFPVVLSLKQLKGVCGENFGYVGVAVDISKRKQMEEALKKSEAENRAIVKSVPDFLFRMNKDGTILDYYSDDNSALYVPPSMFLGKKIHDVLPSSLSDTAMDVMRKSLKSSRAISFEYELPVNNVVRYFENRITAISDSEVLSIIRDITDRKKTENALMESEKKYRRLHESMIDGYVRIDLNGNILESNESYQRLTGYSEKELNTMSIWDITPRKWHDDERRLIEEQVLKRGYSDVYEKEYRRKNGSLCNVEIHAFVLKNDSGDKEGSWAIVRDITMRKKAEEALLLQSAAFESFIYPVVITDADAVIQWVNPAFTGMTGYSKYEAVGKKTSILKSGKHSKEFYKDMWDTVLSGHVWFGELINRRKDGTLYYENDTITPVFDYEGKIVNFIAIKTDITERRKMESDLKESDERWQFALEGSGDGVWDLNLIAKTVFISSQFKQILGYEDNELTLSYENLLRLSHPERMTENIEGLKKLLEGNIDVFASEQRLLCKDGSYKWVMVRGKVVKRNEDGALSRVIGTLTDISRRKEFEEQLRSNLEKEKELNELKSRFISTASHEFRTPLASILLISDALSTYWNDFDSKQINSKLNNIKERVLHLTEIVNDVLHLSKIQSGRVEYDPEEIELTEICRKSIESFSTDEAEKREIVFECGYDSLPVFIDRRLINQILSNLISNALKYSPKDPVIKVKLFTTGDEVNISVSDNGIGIPENDKKYIFSAFYRASNAKLIQGNGLGLNIIKESLLSQGGDISFTSKINSGSTFTVHLPKDKFVR